MNNKVKNYITPNGMKRLMDEYNHLKKTERPEMTKIVAWAASLGDRSENADYQYGKKRLREIDRRLRFLARRIDQAQVVDPLISKAQGLEKVQFSATVTLESVDGEIKKISVVGEDEIDTSKGLISWKSPIGRGLLGREEGDEILIRTPSGSTEYTIETVEYETIEIEPFSPIEHKNIS